VTPAPWGDLTPAECRAEAGPRYVLSGGVPPGSFNSNVPLAVFDAQVAAWLALRHQSPALIIAPGDQLPPDGDLNRVTRMVEAADQAKYD
jgi:uroporphyrinogen-III decarboxylase